MRKLIAVLVLVLLAASTSVTPTATCQGDRCLVARSVCAGAGDLLFQLCTTDHSTSYCLQQYLQYYNSCMRDNGC